MSDIRTYTKLDGDNIIVKREQDVEPIIEANKAIQNLPQKRAGTFRHVGCVPNIILEQWMRDEGVDLLRMNKHEFGKFIKRKLNDPDYLFLKTTPGVV